MKMEKAGNGYMKQILPLKKRDEALIGCLTGIWERSVRASHNFLQEADILAILPDAQAGFLAVEGLYGYLGEAGQLQGFVGVQGEKIEMLFVDDGACGRSIGKALLHFAVAQAGAIYVDVNEDNLQAVGFYKHMGFVQIGRSDLDEQGRAFPILHLRYGGE